MSPDSQRLGLGLARLPALPSAGSPRGAGPPGGRRGPGSASWQMKVRFLRQELKGKGRARRAGYKVDQVPVSLGYNGASALA